jgi:hypothetical protein
MRRRADAVTLLLAIALAACSSGPRPGTTSVPGRGAITVEIAPSPIIAHQVSGETYEFPFDVIIRETGGRPVTVTRVSTTVFTSGLNVGGDSWDANEIRKMGFSPTVPARGELRYHFAPRRSVPDERLFSSLSAELKVEAVDDSVAPTSATAAVTVRR